jgi:pectate lyase
MSPAPLVATLCLLAAAGVGAAGAGSAPAWTLPPGFTATRGGDDGRVVEVTSLAAAGPGSLAAALAAEGPRKIVFTVGGVIDLNGATLRLRAPHATVAGETAPSPGITLIRGGLGIGTHDVILRHLRIRAGEAGRAKKSGWDIDAVATGNGAHDVIIDHCSISWATDENLSASGDRFGGATPDDWRKNTSHRITFHRCLIAEGLRNSTHSKGTGHSMGSLIHDNATDIAIIGNLYLSNNARNPLFKGGARGVVINNLVHNPGGSAISFGLVPEEWTGKEWQRGQMAVAGNVVRQGPSTPAALAPIRFGSNWGAPECDAYLHDNLYLDRAGRPLPLQLAVEARKGLDRSGEFRLVDTPPLWPAGFKALPARDVANAVLAEVGARPWDRDAVDRRLVEEARTGGGKIIDSENEVGGYAGLRTP